MTFKLRYAAGVDKRLRTEMLIYSRWLRKWYSFPIPLEVRLVNSSVLIDDDGVECYLRWWQNEAGRPVTAEIAVGNFRLNLRKDGPSGAYPTVAAAIARAVKYYYQVICDSPIREDYAERWGDRVLDAYVEENTPPPAWKGHKFE